VSEVSKAETTAIVLFDGVCHLCNNSVSFIIRHGRRGYFKFAPLQSPIGQELLRQHHLPSDELDTFVLIEEGKAYTRSTAALRVAKQLDGLWPVAYTLIVVPQPLRNVAYNVVAKSRYKWFGKRETCMIPTAEIKERFLVTEGAS
jgi:predicted DCC family thiol-disulfide oxidoreductase YuxK